MSVVAYTQSESDLTDRVLSLQDRIDYRLAVTDDEKEAIYRLRYSAYLREGAIPPSFSQRLSDRFDDLDNSWIFGLFIDDVLLSSIRITVAYWERHTSPAVDAFPDLLSQPLDEGKVIVDPTRFVIDSAGSRTFPELRYVTTRIAWMACAYFDADLLLASVRREHQAFYRRVFGHQVVAEPRFYPTLVKPLSLTICDYSAMKERVDQRYPFFRSTAFERRMLFGEVGVAAARARKTEAASGEIAPSARVG